MRTTKQYDEDLMKMRNNVYVGGKRVQRNDSMFQPSLNVIRKTFDAVSDPEIKSLIVVPSELDGNDINRFTHTHRSIEDLMKKQEMTRKLCWKSGNCIQRCMGTDALNAVGVVSKEIDEKKGTEYHKNFLNYLKYYQENDLIGNAAQTDVKGDRSKRPHQQKDPDLYLHIVEKKSDGIVVRGAKAHNTTGPYADEIIVLPTRALTKEEGDWAVSFAIPADTEGIKLVCRVSSMRQRKHLDAPGCEFGMSDSMTIFEDVFVPWERVFMCGEWEFGARLALLFANYHRHTYCGCKPAVTDIIMGLTALVAEYNGIGKTPHVVDDISELMILAELVYASGIAASAKGSESSSGIFEPAFIYSNTGRYIAGENIYHEYGILAKAAGGLPSTLPFEEDWYNDDTKDLLHKYIMRNPDISSEDQHRLFRFISDYSCSGIAGVYQYAGVHGGGSPIMEKIGVRATYDLELRKKIVKDLAGIKY